MGWLDTKKDAIAEARKVRATYALRGWTIRTWENMGWHSTLISPNGFWTISWGHHKGRIAYFHAWLKERGEGGAIPGWVQSGKSPFHAIDAVKEFVAKEMKRLRRELFIAQTDPFEKKARKKTK